EPAVIAAAFGLALVSFADDLWGLPPLPRLAAQVAAVFAGLWCLPPESLVFQGLLPLAADRIGAAFLWLWFVNLFNFMDGIDGITGVETLCLSAGLALAGPAVGVREGLVLAGAALGFLRWNWHPASIFLGDVGSVPLGYLLGWLLLQAAAGGWWVVALILPSYYLADATLTLARRLWRGENVLQPHRQHFYQRAVQNGRSHARVATMILGANVLLVSLAVLASREFPGLALGGAITVVVVLLIFLGRPGRL
ncbi:MAG: MraY family glycosyltransferase, partial [Alphaproteobacteria bacterium]